MTAVVLAAGGTVGGVPGHARYSVPVAGGGNIYHAAAGWTVRVPRGWHVVPVR